MQSRQERSCIPCCASALLWALAWQPCHRHAAACNVAALWQQALQLPSARALDLTTWPSWPWLSVLWDNRNGCSTNGWDQWSPSSGILTTCHKGVYTSMYHVHVEMSNAIVRTSTGPSTSAYVQNGKCTYTDVHILKCTYTYIHSAYMRM